MNATRRRVRIVTVREFAERFGADRQCVEHLARRRWQKGFAWPACGHAGSSYVATRRLPRKESGGGLSRGLHRRLEPRAVPPGPQHALAGKHAVRNLGEFAYRLNRRSQERNLFAMLLDTCTKFEAMTYPEPKAAEVN